MPFYVVDSRGCVHFGPTPQEAVRKAREAKDDGSGNNNMDILERPIHCTDPTRKTLYIKEHDKWEKDNEFNKVISGIKTIALKQRTKINTWKNVNKGWETDDNLQTHLTNLVCNSMTMIEEDKKEVNKIVRAISKKTYLTNDIKKEYL